MLPPRRALRLMHPPPDPAPDPSAPPCICPEAVGWRNRYYALLDRLPVPVALCRTDGRVSVANPAMSAALGVSAAGLPGRPLTELLRPLDPAQLHRLARAVRRGDRSRYPLSVMWAGNGTGRHGELTVEPVSDRPRGELMLLAVLREDTSRRTAPAAPAALAQEIGPVGHRILELVATGSTTAAVATATGLTVDGVNYHLRRLSRRLRVANRTALVARAYAVGVLDAGWPPAARHPAPAGPGADGGSPGS
ncbi:PAS domain-containing protein [Streptomyces sp. NPDC059918]|uniref:PAS domain-containing protein n=1 Tax=unclassified Streptomyces TaxID=2593676 RepID=UPI0036517F4E